jgi:ribosome maturation factor RimP
VISKEYIQQLVDEFLSENEGCFLVSLKIGGGNQIEVLIDSYQGIMMKDCVSLSRHIEGNLDREEEDFGLQVASAGLSEGFKVFQQYDKNIGREIDVKLRGGEKMLGKLLSATEGEGIVLETTKKVKVGKKKQEVVEEHQLPFEQIDQTKIVISF